MAVIPDTFLDLMTGKKALAHVAIVGSDGAPRVTPVWFDYEGGRVRINTARGRVKERAMTEGSKVALSIVDPDNDYRYIQVRGTVERVTEEGADAHIDRLSQKYLGKDYPFRRSGEQRVKFDIAPEHAQTMG